LDISNPSDDTYDFDTILSGALPGIYNDPIFTKKDQQYDAAVDAKLLMNDALGYEYGVFLDSTECEISN
jgi:hypothetical protein